MKYRLTSSLSVLFWALIMYACNGVQGSDHLSSSFRTTNTGSRKDTMLYDIIGNFRNGVVIIRINGKEGLYDSINKVLIAPAKYDEINPFADEEVVIFKLGEKYGFLDNNGTQIIPAIYDFATGFDYGLAAVKLDGKFGYIHKDGKIAIPIQYEMAWTFELAHGAVKKDGKWGFIDSHGKYIIRPKYDDVSYDFSEGCPVANVSIGSHHFYIDEQGKYLKDAVPYEKYEQ